MTIPTYLSLYVLTGSAAVIATTLFGLNRALARADWSAQERVRIVGVTAFILVFWLASGIALGALGAFHSASGDIPTIQYGILLPILIGVLLIWRSETVKSIIDAVPQEWLVGVQLYRALGVIFLILSLCGRKAARPVCLAGRRGRHCHRLARPRRGVRLCTISPRSSGSRQSVEHLRHFGSRRSGHDRLHDRALTAATHRGSPQ